MDGGQFSRLENNINMGQKHTHQLSSSVTIKWYSIIYYSGIIVGCSMNINHNDSFGAYQHHRHRKVKRHMHSL
jgi:prolipoprotein diacylglyceryltransferase